MVIIEPECPKPEEEEDEGLKKTMNCSSDASKSLDSGSIVGGDRRDPDSVGHRKQEDDDWETASEGDGDGDGDDEGDGVKSSRGSKLQESFEDAMTEEEQTQVRALQLKLTDRNWNQMCPIYMVMYVYDAYMYIHP